MKLKIFLDDERKMPPKFDLHCRTTEEVIELIKQNKVEFVSLDNDLGEGYSEGKQWLNLLNRHTYQVK